MTIYLGNISYASTEAELFELLTPFGNVFDLNYPTDRETGQHRGFAFVTIADRDVAEKAIRNLDGTMLDGRPLRVSEAKGHQRPEKGIPVGFRRHGENPFGGPRRGR